jgi:hypothetical protein
MDRGITTKIQKATAIKLIEVLRQCRVDEEVRHKDSIRHGAAKRGRKERVPTTRKDYNIVHGDSDSEYKKNYRKENPGYEASKSKAYRDRQAAK